MKYALFGIFLKSGKILICRLLQIIGGALTVNMIISSKFHFLKIFFKSQRHYIA